MVIDGIASVDECEVWELCRLTITGRFFLPEPANPPFFFPSDGDDFLSDDVEFWGSVDGDGGSTTTCEFVCELALTEDDRSASASDSGGEMKRAVGRGPLVDGPLVFLRMGCGIGTGFLEVVEDEVVLGRLWSDRWMAVVLEAPGPRREFVCYDSKIQYGFGLYGQTVHTNGGVPSSRFGGPRSGTKVSPSEIWANSRATVVPFNSLFRLPQMRHQ